MLCGLSCYVAVLASGGSLPRRISPCHAIFSPYWGYEQFPFFSNSSSFWKQRVMGRRRECLPPSFPSISLLAQQSTLRASYCACFLPAQLVRSSPPPCSRGGRPVSAKPIGKQRPKIYLPVSFPSSTSKHSNRSRKSVVGPQFLPMMICCHLSAASSTTKI